MKVEEIRKMSDEELSSELASLKEELFKLRFQHATNQLDNPAQI
ncbi:MAG: 50S ribosomal protein L29, partial [Clostridiales bacterium]|nr:50S ribosomal protein L29 [Clostridiales bacterium]